MVLGIPSCHGFALTWARVLNSLDTRQWKNLSYHCECANFAHVWKHLLPGTDVHFVCPFASFDHWLLPVGNVFLKHKDSYLQMLSHSGSTVTLCKLYLNVFHVS